MSEPRCLRSKRLRTLLYSASDGKCAMCGCELMGGWHADHVIPWKQSGRTNVHEMQALCPECNYRKADKSMVVPLSNLLDLSQARPGQRKAFQVIVDRVIRGEKKTAIILPTGYGKSDVIMMSAFYLWATNAIACSVVLSPNEYLRDQMIHRSKIDGFRSRYKPRVPNDRKLSYSALVGYTAQLAPNNEFLLSATTQLFARNPHDYARWAESMTRQGKPVLIFVDETHTHAVSNKWGEMVAILDKAGASHVHTTATGMRDDGDAMIGFDLVEKEAKPVAIYKCKPGSEPEKVVVQLWEGEKKYYTIKAHYEVTPKEGWDEGVLCRINRHFIDVPISILGEKEDTRMLSDLNESETRKVLGRLVRHPEVIRLGCRELVLWLKRVRGTFGDRSKNCRAVVFSSNDRPDEQVNAHAEEIKKCILAIDSSLRVRIATSADGGESATGERSGKEIIEAFVNDSDGDIIIVKQMASIGMDCPPIKVELDLSPVRAPNAFIQRINRATRPYSGIQVAHLISLKDILTEACFEKFVAAENGATTQEIELIDEYERDKQDQPDQPEYVIHSPIVGNVQDTDGGVASRKDIPRILALIEQFPSLVSEHTIPEIAAKMNAAGLIGFVAPSDAIAGFHNSGLVAKDIKSPVLAKVRSITDLRLKRQGRRYTKSPDDREFYRTTIKSVWNDVYRRARLPKGFDFKTSTDETALTAVSCAIDEMLEEEVP